MPRGLILLLLLATACASPLQKAARQECKPCNPQGATDTKPPLIGPQMDSLFIDVLQSVRDIRFNKRWADLLLARKNAFCCAENLDCVNVLNLNIPMCYDKFTTHYAFPDGSWGSLTTGEYFESTGGHANLLTGEYTKSGGEKGDIYSAEPEEKPNTATLSIPQQWTDSGVGSAIPPTEIASIVTDGPAQTSSNPTTTPRGINTETTQQTAAPPASSTAAARHVGVGPNMSVALSLLNAAMYFLYAL